MDSPTAANSLVPLFRKEGDALVVTVAGEVDLNNSPELRDILMDLVCAHRPARVVLDLALVPYMDSSAVAVLVELLRKVGRGGVTLKGVQPRVRGILEIARLNTIFHVAES